MVFLYIIAGIAALFALILSLGLSVRVTFHSSAEENMKIYAKIGFYKIHIMPAKQKKPKPEKPKKAKPEKAKKPKKEEKPKEKKKYAITEIFGLIKEIGAILLKRFKKHFKVKIYGIRAILSADDAEKTAILYGAAIQSAYYMFEFLEHNFKIRRKPGSVTIIPDFSKTQPSFGIDVKFYMRLSHMAALGIASAAKFLKFWKNSKT